MGDAVARMAEASELYDVQVEQIARVLMLIAPGRLIGLQGGQTVEAVAMEDACDGGARGS